MIPCFPSHFADELLYSICARYSDRMEYPQRETAMQELWLVTAFKWPGQS